MGAATEPRSCRRRRLGWHRDSGQRGTRGRPGRRRSRCVRPSAPVSIHGWRRRGRRHRCTAARRASSSRRTGCLPGRSRRSHPQHRILGREVEVVVVVLAAGAGVGAGRRVVTGSPPSSTARPCRVGPTIPEGELATVGPLAVAAGHDLLPLRLACGARSARRGGARIRSLAARFLGGLEVRRVRINAERAEVDSLGSGSGKLAMPRSRMHCETPAGRSRRPPTLSRPRRVRRLGGWRCARPAAPAVAVCGGDQFHEGGHREHVMIRRWVMAPP